MKTRIYLVNEQNADDPNIEPTQHLVRASSQSQAVKHVAGTRFTAAVATTDDLAVMIPEGVSIQTAGPESQADAGDV